MNYYGRCRCGKRGTRLLEFRLGPDPLGLGSKDPRKLEHMPLCPRCWRLEQLQAAGVVHERFLEGA